MASRPSFHYRPPAADAPSWGLRVTQWLLVLLLAWDQAGSPLHRHHHDSGIDGYALAVVSPDVSHGDGATDVRHAEDADGGFHFSHAVMAVRPQPQLSRIAPSAETESVALAWSAPASANAAWVADPRFLPWPGTHPVVHSPHRSLPPAGRAPPLHA